jgi:hypothetical protein
VILWLRVILEMGRSRDDSTYPCVLFTESGGSRAWKFIISVKLFVVYCRAWPIDAFAKALHRPIGNLMSTMSGSTTKPRRYYAGSRITCNV